MGETMIERATASMIAALRDDANSDMGCWVNDVDDGFWQIDGTIKVAAIARAVIASLREPSEGVADAGSEFTRSSLFDATKCFNAMIDAILEEPKA